MDKVRFSYDDIHQTVSEIASSIRGSDFTPEVIVAIGAGGLIPARMLRAYFSLPLYVVTLASYQRMSDGTEKSLGEPVITQWLDDAKKQVEGKRILVVDEIDDSRKTLDFCCRKLLEHNPQEIALTVLHNKGIEKRGILPDELNHYFIGLNLEGGSWVVYPWDIEDSTEEHDALARANKKNL